MTLDTRVQSPLQPLECSTALSVPQPTGQACRQGRHGDPCRRPATTWPGPARLGSEANEKDARDRNAPLGYQRQASCAPRHDRTRSSSSLSPEPGRPRTTRARPRVAVAGPSPLVGLVRPVVRPSLPRGVYLLVVTVGSRRAPPRRVVLRWPGAIRDSRRRALAAPTWQVATRCSPFVRSRGGRCAGQPRAPGPFCPVPARFFRDATRVSSLRWRRGPGLSVMRSASDWSRGRGVRARTYIRCCRPAIYLVGNVMACILWVLAIASFLPRIVSWRAVGASSLPDSLEEFGVVCHASLGHASAVTRDPR